MEDMPKSAQEAYDAWKCAYPGSTHRYDYERFYKFVRKLLESREPREPSWLEELLTKDCLNLNLSEEQIKELVNKYEIILDYQKT